MFPTAHESPWPVIYQHRYKAAAATSAGLALGAGAKYVAAAFLILWLAAGGQ